MYQFGRQLAQHRQLSEQDGGPFLEVATLWQEGEQLLLTISAGYYSEAVNDYDVYLLDRPPIVPLEQVFGYDLVCNPGTDQSDQLSEGLGIRVSPFKE